jgi:hypothetical protein
MSRLSPVRALRRQLKTIAADFADDLIPTSIAADFLNGGAPGFARIFDRRGRRLTTVQRRENESWAVFVARAKGEAANAAQAACTLIGGLPDGDLDDFDNDAYGHDSDPPRNAIILPETPLHPSQVEALDLIRGNRRVVLVCGRRWGKLSLLVALAVDAALSGQRVGIFAPTRTLLSPLLHAVAHALRGVKGATINRMFGEIRLPNGGHVDFWSIDTTGDNGSGVRSHWRPGRCRHAGAVLCDLRLCRPQQAFVAEPQRVSCQRDVVQRLPSLSCPVTSPCRMGLLRVRVEACIVPLKRA